MCMVTVLRYFERPATKVSLKSRQEVTLIAVEAKSMIAWATLWHNNWTSVLLSLIGAFNLTELVKVLH